MKKIYLILTLISQFALAQEPRISLYGKVLDIENLGLSNAEIVVTFDDSSLLYQSKTNGKYGEINLVMGKCYTITFSKKKYISKSIIIDASNNYFPDDAMPINTLEIPIELNLSKKFKKRKLPKKPMILGRLVIDPKTAGLQVDFAYTSKLKSEYEKRLKDASKK